MHWCLECQRAITPAASVRSLLLGETKAAPEGAANSALARRFRGSARGRVAAGASEWVGTGWLAGGRSATSFLFGSASSGSVGGDAARNGRAPGSRQEEMKGIREEKPEPGASAANAASPSPLLRLLSALFYGICSFCIVLVNKAVLTAYRFPSPVFLGLGQMVTTILILYVSKLNRIIHFPDFDKRIPMKLFPLPLIYVGNHISGLSSTSKLSLPMFTVLRKFTIPLTLLLEMIVLGKRYPPSIVISVFAIILGAFIAAGSDLAFSMEGYASVLLNDVFTAANGVYTKQKIDPKELGKYGVIFYNACFMVIPTVLISFFSGDFQQATNFKEWTNVLFIFQFLLSCVLGFLLMYSTVLCSHYNSPLTTTVVGAIKNVSIAYIGMLFGGDYIFSMLNFIGLNICMAGGLRYSFLTIRGNDNPQSSTDEEEAEPGAKS
ncbi:UDP-N-acetylglucosamine/UDP-glucose/GDP-mannose transporter [Lacerta agilis]|uniref:UDP-N-acetylglucosamine/UDP-glucose/GDP-mannose transporter n=1 Tax=Lacerta agilis TaxID=80427 RepID=UPI0014198B5C|nr:UDP-N-acetylglucosamine/UDP-glucose/GDP-mannose transporter [Lacerta agilis]